jgi:ribosome maturation protein Sdo1
VNDDPELANLKNTVIYQLLKKIIFKFGKRNRSVSVKEMIMCCGTTDIFDIVNETMQRPKPSII